MYTIEENVKKVRYVWLRMSETSVSPDRKDFLMCRVNPEN